MRFPVESSKMTRILLMFTIPATLLGEFKTKFFQEQSSKMTRILLMFTIPATLLGELGTKFFQTLRNSRL